MASLKAKFEKIREGQTSERFEFLKSEPAQLLVIPTESIDPDPDQPRKNIGDISDLKASIAEHGIIQPIIVAVAHDERYRLIAGERRFTAAKALGLETVPCIVRTVEEHRVLEVQLVENLHRKDLNPVEEATTYKRLIEDFGLSQRDLATRLGKSAATINQTLRILSLPETIIESVQTSEQISRSVLLEIAKLESEQEQIEMFEGARTGKLTVKGARDKKVGGSQTLPLARTRFPFPTKTAHVVVTFDQAEVTDEEVVAALTEALKLAKARTKNLDK